MNHARQTWLIVDVDARRIRTPLPGCSVRATVHHVGERIPAIRCAASPDAATLTRLTREYELPVPALRA